MTRKDRIRAFCLRLDGCSWRQVGAALGYDARAVQRDLERMVRRGQRRPRTPYTALARFIMQECGGSIKEFARLCGVPYSTMYAVLTEERAPGEGTLERILATTGLTVEEAFATLEWKERA